MIFRISLITLFFAVVFGLYTCQKEVELISPELIDFSKIPFQNLSEYGFFKGAIQDLKPSDNVIPFEPASALFTDYAHKSRFVWMPENTGALIPDDGAGLPEFPDRSILIKNFYYPLDFRKPEAGKRIIETRLLVKYEGKWDAYAYLWNDAQSDAVYKITGASIPVSFIDEEGAEQQIDYLQPNKNQCKSCHNIGEALMPIGPKVRNLNCELDYGSGDLANQLSRWSEFGYLKGYEASKQYEALPDYRDTSLSLDMRAKAYLDINCGHCHNASSPASTSGLFMTWEEEDPMKWGVLKTPVAAGIGAGPHTFDILPGNADSSIMIYRMNSKKPGVMMAEIGRVMIHKEGVKLIEDWINNMEPRIRE